MQSSVNHTTPDSIQKTVWLLLAVALNTLELFIPRIPLFPWLKPGLANSITILWIIRFGGRDALLYTLLRVWITSFYFGFSLITVSLSLAGGLLATTAMGITWHILGKKQLIGTIGLALIGAVMHNTGQLIAVYFLLTKNSALFYQVPFMGGAALVFGGFIGVVTPLFWNVLVVDAPPFSQQTENRPFSNQSHLHFLPIAGSILLIVGSIILVAVSDSKILAVIAISITITAFCAGNRAVSMLFYPLRFWFLFLFIGCVYLFFSYGTKVSWFPLITYEGIQLTLSQFIRLWIWIEVSLLLHKLHCNHLFFIILRKLFPKNAGTLFAGLLALEYFADVLDYVKGKQARKNLPWKKPPVALAQFVMRVQEYVKGLIDRR